MGIIHNQLQTYMYTKIRSSFKGGMPGEFS